MSKRRKTTRGNPAKADQIRIEAQGAWDDFMEFMRDSVESGMDKARKELLEAGASEEQIDRLMRVHRCRIAYEALEAGDVHGFERITAPVANEIEIQQLIGKANELGMDEYLEDTDER
jgi:hypothetical protein